MKNTCTKTVVISEECLFRFKAFVMQRFASHPVRPQNFDFEMEWEKELFYQLEKLEKQLLDQFTSNSTKIWFFLHENKRFKFLLTNDDVSVSYL